MCIYPINSLRILCPAFGDFEMIGIGQLKASEKSLRIPTPRQQGRAAMSLAIEHLTEAGMGDQQIVETLFDLMIEERKERGENVS